MPATRKKERPTSTSRLLAQEKVSGQTRLFIRLNFLGWLLLICGIIGFAASFVLTVEKIHLLQNPAASPICDLNPVISCGSVMKTEQSSVFGFANSLIGVGAFAALVALGMALLAGAQFKKWFWWLIQAGMLFGLVFVHWLFFQSLYVIGSLCPFCMAVWVVTITSAWYITLYNLQAGNIPPPAKYKSVADFAGRHHGDILAIWFIVLTALILQRFRYYWETLI